MQTIKVKGIVINDTNYSESSKILNIITQEKGLISVISKGCRNYKSKLRSSSGKLTYGYFYINYKENTLSTLIEVDIINDLKNIKTDIKKDTIRLERFFCSMVHLFCFLIQIPF